MEEKIKLPKTSPMFDYIAYNCCTLHMTLQS